MLIGLLARAEQLGGWCVIAHLGDRDQNRYGIPNSSPPPSLYARCVRRCGCILSCAHRGSLEDRRDRNLDAAMQPFGDCVAMTIDCVKDSPLCTIEALYSAGNATLQKLVYPGSNFSNLESSKKV
jgi:hypothetical protein